jgi:NodT family efflux transporter outer membrane factor (OMF) lipoprotein
VRTTEERLVLARTNVALQQNTLRITQQRQEAQVVSDLDVQQARSSVAVTAALIPALEQAHRQAQNHLCILMGMPPQDLQARLGGPGKIPHTRPEVAIGIPAELLRRRPDVRRAERLAAAQSARIGIAESDLYPHFSLTGNIRFEAETFSNLLDDESIAGSVGPGFNWNVLNYGRLMTNVRVQDARVQQLVLQYQQTVLQASEEAENAIAAYLFEQARVKQLQQSADAIARATELATLQYEEGLIDFQRLLDSQRALVLQQDALAESRGTVALQLVALYKALGGGWRMRLEPNRSASLEQVLTPNGPEVVPPGAADESADDPSPLLLPTPEAPGQT